MEKSQSEGRVHIVFVVKEVDRINSTKVKFLISWNIQYNPGIGVSPYFYSCNAPRPHQLPAEKGW